MSDLAGHTSVYTGVRELIKRVAAGSPASADFALDGVLDPNWIRMWLVVYGGSLSILAAYLMSVILRIGGERWGIE